MSTLNPTLKPPAQKELEDFLGRYIKGQPLAVEALAKAYAAFISGIGKANERDSKKPISIFLFAGPSCTGKTQIGRRLAQKFHGTLNAITLIDCVSFQEKHEISKLIGAPPGYIGYEELGRQPGIEHLGCMAHVRRKYVDVTKASSKAEAASCRFPEK